MDFDLNYWIAGGRCRRRRDGAAAQRTGTGQSGRQKDGGRRAEGPAGAPQRRRRKRASLLATGDARHRTEQPPGRQLASPHLDRPRVQLPKKPKSFVCFIFFSFSSSINQTPSVLFFPFSLRFFFSKSFSTVFYWVMLIVDFVFVLF